MASKSFTGYARTNPGGYVQYNVSLRCDWSVSWERKGEYLKFYVNSCTAWWYTTAGPRWCAVRVLIDGSQYGDTMVIPFEASNSQTNAVPYSTNASINVGYASGSKSVSLQFGVYCENGQYAYDNTLATYNISYEALKPIVGTVTVSNIKSDSAFIEWDGFEAQGDATIDKYLLKYGDTDWTRYPKFATKIDLFGLEPNTTYTVEVKAVDSNGLESDIASVTFTTLNNEGTIYIKDNDIWRKGQVYIKQNGMWKKAKNIYVKQNGIWKKGS